MLSKEIVLNSKELLTNHRTYDILEEGFLNSKEKSLFK